MSKDPCLIYVHEVEGPPTPWDKDSRNLTTDSLLYDWQFKPGVETIGTKRPSPLIRPLYIFFMMVAFDRVYSITCEIEQPRKALDDTSMSGVQLFKRNPHLIMLFELAGIWQRQHWSQSGELIAFQWNVSKAEHTAGLYWTAIIRKLPFEQHQRIPCDLLPLAEWSSKIDLSRTIVEKSVWVESVKWHHDEWEKCWKYFMKHRPVSRPIAEQIRTYLTCGITSNKYDFIFFARFFLICPWHLLFHWYTHCQYCRPYENK